MSCLGSHSTRIGTGRRLRMRRFCQICKLYLMVTLYANNLFPKMTIFVLTKTNLDRGMYFRYHCKAFFQNLYQIGEKGINLSGGQKQRVSSQDTIVIVPPHKINDVRSTSPELFTSTPKS